MKKRLIACAMAMIMVFSLMACGNKKEENFKKKMKREKAPSSPYSNRQENIDLDIAIKQVVNEVGTMVNYGEYGYAISTEDYESKKYLTVSQLNSEDEENATGYKIFSTMNIGEIYNRTNETFKLIVCYKDLNNKKIEFLYKIHKKFFF